MAKFTLTIEDTFYNTIVTSFQHSPPLSFDSPFTGIDESRLTQAQKMGLLVARFVQDKCIKVDPHSDLDPDRN